MPSLSTQLSRQISRLKNKNNDNGSSYKVERIVKKIDYNAAKQKCIVLCLNGCEPLKEKTNNGVIERRKLYELKKVLKYLYKMLSLVENEHKLLQMED